MWSPRALRTRHADAGRDGAGAGSAYAGDVQAPRLVATDVDGTLLDPDSRVTPRAAAVIERLLASGVEEKGTTTGTVFTGAFTTLARALARAALRAFITKHRSSA